MATGIRKMMILKCNPKVVQARDETGEPITQDGVPVLVLDYHPIYLDITTDEDRGRAALSVLKMRFCGKNATHKLVPPEKPKPCPIDQSAFMQMKSSDEGYEEAYQQVRKFADIRRDYDNAVRKYDALVRCLQTDDAQLAAAILEERRYLKGEGYDIDLLYDECP
jgi:hypothetical protein